MNDALPSPEFNLNATGKDHFFLVDTEAGPTVVGIAEMAEWIEADAYYDEPGRMTNAHIYWLRRGCVPTTVKPEYTIYGRNSEYTYKILRLYGPTGEVIAQHTYTLPN